MDREYTPDNITKLPENGIFVFGSNTEGRHGKGAAKIARYQFGAIYGQSKGLQGQSYGIITKDLKRGLKSIPLEAIKFQLYQLFKFVAAIHKNNKYYVTKLGSSLAGYTIEQIKGIIKDIYDEIGIPNNIILPKEYEVRD